MNKYVNNLIYFFKFLKYLNVLTSGENNEQNLIFSNLSACPKQFKFF